MWDAGEALRLQLVQGCACGGGLLTCWALDTWLLHAQSWPQ